MKPEQSFYCAQLTHRLNKSGRATVSIDTFKAHPEVEALIDANVKDKIWRKEFHEGSGKYFNIIKIKKQKIKD